MTSSHPSDKQTIFISIAAYRDPELVPTIKDCLNRAKFPKRLVFGVCWQHAPEDRWDTLEELKNDQRVKVLDVNSRDSQGVCWARSEIQRRLFDDEDYFLQIDSHHRFVENWDEELVDMFNAVISPKCRKPIISGLPARYFPAAEGRPEIREGSVSLTCFRTYTEENVLLIRPATLTERELSFITRPFPARFLSAGFLFAPGTFVREVPYDPNLYFEGEEPSLTARAFTHGYDLFHPHRIILFHEYTRVDKPQHWKDDSKWLEKDAVSKARVRKLFGIKGFENIDLGGYTLGTTRSLGDYEKYAGVNCRIKGVQQYTLNDLIPPNPEIENPKEYENSFIRTGSEQLYYIGDSRIHGKGVFANHALGKGENVGPLHVIKANGLYDFTELGRFHNHSNHPNCHCERIGNSRFLIASRDIPFGEELTTNYRLQPDLEQPEHWGHGENDMRPHLDGYRIYSLFKNLEYIIVEGNGVDCDGIIYDLVLLGDNGVLEFGGINTGVHYVNGATRVVELPLKDGESAYQLFKDEISLRNWLREKIERVDVNREIRNLFVF